MHKVGDLVRNRANGWLGRVVHVECMVCGEELVDDGCPSGHNVGQRMKYDGSGMMVGYCISVAQNGVPGDLRPWCIAENFPVVVIGKTAWERLLEDRLVSEV